MEKLKEIEIGNLEELQEFAKLFVQELLPNATKVFFYGEMGVGKTTLIKMLCTALGVQEETASPTYALINQYALPHSDKLIHHADLYRLESTEEVYDIGLEDLLHDKHYLFVEWPQFLEPLAPAQLLGVNIAMKTPHRRKVEVFLIKNA